MNCKYFGQCGSCTLYDKTYEEQLDFKLKREEERFKEFSDLKFDIIKSTPQNFRNRAEFRFWKNYDEEDHPTIHYAMNDFDRKALEIDSCQIVSSAISNLMPILLEEIKKDALLSQRIYSCEFLSSTSNDMLVTLIYHRKLDEEWIIKAKELEKKLQIKIIGRSRKQKEILSVDYISEKLLINDKTFSFNYFEGGFTQPNAKVNEKMIEWVLNNIESKDDLCELYCGGGNFTIPLSTQFNKVLATEISKTSIKSAKINCELNSITNIEFIRMSSEEFVEALDEKREFKRLKDIELKDYNFSTIFMDPPRAGLDKTTTRLAQEFEQIIYISCNPETLHRDLLELTKTHQVLKLALFDQFAYTNHIESGVILTKL